MAVFISGSVAYDTIFRFDGIFADHLQGDLRKLNLTFQSSQMRRQFGGCAGNIAYALKSLGGDPLIVTTVGQDADPYLEHFKACGIRTEGILKVQDDFTAQAMITTDRLGNQLCTFHEGAMALAAQASCPRHVSLSCGIITPTATSVMKAHTEFLCQQSVPVIWDMGQASAYLSGRDILWFLQRIDILTVSHFEWDVLLRKTGLSQDEVTRQVQAVIVTQGEQGADLIQGTEKRHYPALAIKETANPVGCGDAFRGGLLFGLQKNLGWDKAMKLATLMGAVKAQYMQPQGYSLEAPPKLALFEETFAEALFD